MATTIPNPVPGSVPTYNSAVTKILPFSNIIEMAFRKVTFRFYPLPADRNKLQDFCDKHLNFVSEPESERPPVYFRAPLPYVLLQLVDYPRMEQGAHWLKSREVIFAIPLEWYRRDKGNLVFQNWAMTFPFIYLDSPISIAIGRELYGFPKTQIQVVQDPTQPARFGQPQPLLLAPGRPNRLVAYNLPKFTSKKPGEPQEFSESFLELYQDPRPYPWSVSRPADLFSIWPRATASYLSTISALAEATAAVTRAAIETPALWALPKAAFSFFAGAAEQLQKVAGESLIQAGATLKTDFKMPQVPELTTFATMIQQSMGIAGSWLPQMFSPFVEPRSVNAQEVAPSPFMHNLISLKQFPDAEDSSKACYQSIVRSSSNFETANDTGLLFDPISGDPSGGISIRIYDREPIVDCLGIKASREPETDYSIVKPLFPFWWNLDVGYGSAENLCWRTKDSAWSHAEPTGRKVSGKHNCVRLPTSSADLEVPKPFAKPTQITLQILPLPADLKGLENLCNELLKGCKPPRQVRPAAPYILMFVSQFQSVNSGGDKPRDWADTEVTFALPAYESSNNQDTPVLLPLMGLVGSEWNAITDREIYGRFSLQAEMKVGDNRTVNDLSISPATTPELWFYVDSPVMGDRGEEDIRPLYAIVGVTRCAADGSPAPGSVPAKTLPFTSEPITSDRAAAEADATEADAAKADAAKADAAKADAAKADAAKADEAEAAAAKADEAEADAASASAANWPSLKAWLDKVGFSPDSKGKPINFQSIALKQFRDAADPTKACYQSLVSVSRTFNAESDRKWIGDYNVRLRVHVRVFTDFSLYSTLCLQGTSILPDSQPAQTNISLPPQVEAPTAHAHVQRQRPDAARVGRIVVENSDMPPFFLPPEAKSPTVRARSQQQPSDAARVGSMVVGNSDMPLYTLISEGLLKNQYSLTEVIDNTLSQIKDEFIVNVEHPIVLVGEISGDDSKVVEQPIVVA